MRILKSQFPASSASRLFEELSITESYAGTKGVIELTVPNKEVYTPNGKSLELWLKRDGAGMRVFDFTEIDSKTISINRDSLPLREGDVLTFIEYYGYVDNDTENVQRVMDVESRLSTLEENYIKKDEVVDKLIPLGFGYIQFGGSPLPGDTLLDADENDITDSDDFSEEDLNNCMYSKTTWKLAVREGDFLRQVGSRSNEDELEISTAAFGESQEDQFQGHKIQIYTKGSDAGSYTGGGYISSGGTNYEFYWPYKAIVSYQDIITNGSNGTPRTGVETRPVNTAVRFWVRVA